jgi:membrane protein implicated in regulation of membrane protease activity
MAGRQFYFGSSSNPLVQILSLLVFGVLLAGAFILGTFVLIGFIGLAFVGAAVFSVRLWWLRRKLARRMKENGGPGPGREGEGPYVIEGEFEVLESDAAKERRRSQ